VIDATYKLLFLFYLVYFFPLNLPASKHHFFQRKR
jgi:hypothetical protein